MQINEKLDIAKYFYYGDHEDSGKDFWRMQHF